MSSLDFYLFYDEDQDLDHSQMPDFTPVEPVHIIELHERGLIDLGEVFSHRGWHHQINWINGAGEYRLTVWDGPTGEEYFCKYPTYGNCWD